MTENNQVKTKDLIHYICAKGAEHASFGATMLNKILWFCDIAEYLSTGRTLTNLKYIKKQYGPVPTDILSKLDELDYLGKISISEQNDYYGMSKKKFCSLREPSLDNITAENIALIDKVIDHICLNFTASEISELTHNEIWKAAEMGEEIPLYTVLASKYGQVTDAHKSWADSKIEKML